MLFDGKSKNCMLCVLGVTEQVTRDDVHELCCSEIFENLYTDKLFTVIFVKIN